jgi:hypothetical protein
VVSEGEVRARRELRRLGLVFDNEPFAATGLFPNDLNLPLLDDFHLPSL